MDDTLNNKVIPTYLLTYLLILKRTHKSPLGEYDTRRTLTWHPDAILNSIIAFGSFILVALL